MSPSSTLYERICRCRLVPKDVLEEIFEETFKELFSPSESSEEPKQEEEPQQVEPKDEVLTDSYSPISAIPYGEKLNDPSDRLLTSRQTENEEDDFLSLFDSQVGPSELPEKELQAPKTEDSLPPELVKQSKETEDAKEKSKEDLSVLEQLVNSAELIGISSDDLERSESFFELDGEFEIAPPDENLPQGESEEEEKEEGDESNANLTASQITPEQPSGLLTQESRRQFETRFLEKLLERKAINHWQAAQLAAGRSTFKLGGYRIVDQLGQGGYGRVFLGRKPEITSNVDKTGVKFKDDVAIKVLPIKIASKEAIGRFIRECEISKRLNHPNVIRYYQFAKEKSIHYCISEYVNGGDARKLLAQFLRSGSRINYRIVCYIISEVAKGLDYIHHQGLVHRDVKPGNILLMKSGEVKLGDFGLSIPIRNFSKSATFSPLGEFVNEWERENADQYFESYEKLTKRMRQVQGTPDYLSPDQIRTPAFPEPSWDIYSLGCSLYFMLTGIVPYPSSGSLEALVARMQSGAPPEPREFDFAIPSKLSNLTMAMIQKAPSNYPYDKINTAKQVYELLQPWVDKEEVSSFITWKLSNEDNFWSQEKLQACFVDRQFKPLAATEESPVNQYLTHLKYKSGQDSSNGAAQREAAPNLASIIESRVDLSSLKKAESKTDSLDRKKKSANNNASGVKRSSDVRATNMAPILSSNFAKTRQTSARPAKREKTVKKKEKDFAIEIQNAEELNRKLIKYVLFPLLGLVSIAILLIIIKLFV